MTEGNKQTNDTKEDEPLSKVDALNRKYYTIFEELKEARPALANCDAAFLSFVQNITEEYNAEAKLLTNQFLNLDGETAKSWERMEKFNALCERFYFMGERLKANKEKLPEGLFALMKTDMEIEYQKLYDLFAGEYNPEMDRKIAEQQALHDRIVPQRWIKLILRVFKRKKQNYAATLVDMEANERAAKVFAVQEAKITELAAERFSAEVLAAEFREKLAVYEAEQLAEAQRLAENGENGEVGQEGAGGEQSAESASEGNSEGGETSGAAETEKPAESASDRAMKEYLRKKKKGKKQSDKSE